MNKIYCCDCKEFSRHSQGANRCTVIEDDWFSSTHEVYIYPEVLNAKNACPHFEMKKSGK